MTKWISEKTKPQAYEPVFLALTCDDYTTGHWASKVGHWIGYALNQTPPIYVLEEGAVKYWMIIEPSVSTIEYPHELDHLSDDELAELADFVRNIR